MKWFFLCDLMTNPVVASDGFTYERETIEKWFETSGNSPRTGALLQHKILGRGSMKGEGKYRALYDDVDHEAQRISRLGRVSTNFAGPSRPSSGCCLSPLFYGGHQWTSGPR